MSEKTIIIASDHAGFERKSQLVDYLKTKQYDVVDLGPDNGQNSIDYPMKAKELALKLEKNKDAKGILVCGSGIGMSIAANKVSGIIAAKVNTPREEKLCKEHNLANVMTLAEYTENLEEILENFVYTKPSTEERHIRRLEKINHLE